MLNAGGYLNFVFVNNVLVIQGYVFKYGLSTVLVSKGNIVSKHKFVLGIISVMVRHNGGEVICQNN